MLPILLFTILGFLIGLGMVMRKRKIEPGKVLSAAFLGLLSVGILKIFRDFYKDKKRYF
ncbi:MAG: hypothetical protein AB1481_07570 [Candidatus Omnitrophota bacterium]